MVTRGKRQTTLKAGAERQKTTLDRITWPTPAVGHPLLEMTLTFPGANRCRYHNQNMLKGRWTVQTTNQGLLYACIHIYLLFVLNGTSDLAAGCQSALGRVHTQRPCLLPLSKLNGHMSVRFLFCAPTSI